MSATVLSFFRPAPSTNGDWSQQELAEFYRVEAASLQAGLRLAIERGLSDEGDPWLVFCREDGEVFLHFARTDGSYVIVSDMLGEPLVGPNFRELLAELVARNPSVLPINRQTLGGSGGRSGAQILMHPAALLAAIVATTCLFSSMGEAVAGELQDGRHAPDGASDAATSSDRADIPLIDLGTHASDADPATRSRSTESRELATTVSLVMACMASLLTHDGHEVASTSPVWLSPWDGGLSSATSVHAEVPRLTTAEQQTVARDAATKSRSDVALDAAASAQTEPGSLFSALPVLQQGNGIALTTPNETIIAFSLELARFGPTARDLPAAAGGQMVYVLRAAGSGHAQTVPAPAPDVPSAKPSELPSASASTSAAIPTAGSNLEGAGTPTASSEGLAHSHAGNPDGGSPSVTRATTLSSAPVSASAAGSAAQIQATPAHSDMSTKLAVPPITTPVLVADTKPITVSLVSPETDLTAGKKLSEVFRDEANLTSQSVSKFLHSLLGRNSGDQLADPLKGASTAYNLVVDKPELTGSAQSVITTNPTTEPDLTQVTDKTKTNVSIEPAGATQSFTPTSLTTKAASAQVEAQGKAEAQGKVDASVAHTDNHSTSDPAAQPISKGMLPTEVVVSSGAAVSKTLVVVNADTVDKVPANAGGGTAPAPISVTHTDATPPTAVGPAALISVLQDKSDTNVIVDHTTAVQSAAVLFSSANTASQTISLSLSGTTGILDSDQLKIIDSFIAHTPNLQMKVFDNILQLYDPTLVDNASVRPVSWDIGGGSIVQIVGLLDAPHPGPMG